MANNDKIELEGTVVAVNKGTKFDVKLDINDAIVSCTLSGRLRMNNIRVLLNDHVTINMSPYDLTKGIIIWRVK